MKEHIENVKKFHEQLNIPLDISLVSSYDRCNSAELFEAAFALQKLSQQFEVFANTDKNDVRLTRAHLFLEEVAECLHALLMQDDVLLLDALADIMFITIGTAVTYDLPIEEALTEVERSNLTKRRLPDDVRCRDKGPNYEPPKLKEILDNYKINKEKR